MRLVCCLLAITLLTGCITRVEYGYKGEREARFLAESMGNAPFEPTLVTLELNDEIRASLDERINPRWNDRQKLKAIRNYLYSESELNVRYDANSTRTAIETFKSRKGNCLALTTLFIAAARYVGLDANYRTVEVRPTWDHTQGMMVRYEHIVASGKINGEKYILDFLPEFYASDQEGKRISDMAALALYYNNLGAENILDGDSEQAIIELRKSLALDAGHSDTWNNLGAAFNRTGNSELAEFSYHRALYEDAVNYSALSNLARLYKSQNREEEAAVIHDSVVRYRERNPYYFFYIAQVMYQDERYEDVILLLENSIRLKRDDPDFYVALATTYASLGDDAASAEQLAIAERIRSEKESRFFPDERIMNHRMVVIKERMSRINLSDED